MYAYEFEISACERQTQYSRLNFKEFVLRAIFFKKALYFPNV